MSYYPDLSPYNYTHHCEKELNIGWIQKGQVFIVGEVPEDFIKKLKVYSESQNKYFKTRGWHQCEFCDDKEAQGDCELRIIGKDGIVYACPFLIVHYIEKHKYLPPQQFIDAVINGPAPGSEEYKNMINRLPESWEQRKPDLNDEDYEENMMKIMVDNLSKEVDQQIMNDLMKESSDFKKFVESYNKVMPAVYLANKKK